MQQDNIYQSKDSCPPPKQAYRSEKEEVIAGVAGGMGEYFRIDPDIIRVLFVALGLFFGLGAVVYLILWIFLPSQSQAGAPANSFIPQNLKEIISKLSSTASSLTGQPSTQKQKQKEKEKQKDQEKQKQTEVKGVSTIKIECPAPSGGEGGEGGGGGGNTLRIIVSIIVIIIGLVVIVISGLGVFDFLGFGPVILIALALIVLFILIR
jgi:phage shock protein PspC (stress-responsive transcriptional regulator)